ncbi:MAG: hypothetical protein ABIA04_02715 [Pseudomonadota bacterium]
MKKNLIMYIIVITYILFFAQATFPNCLDLFEGSKSYSQISYEKIYDNSIKQRILDWEKVAHNWVEIVDGENEPAFKRMGYIFTQGRENLNGGMISRPNNIPFGNARIYTLISIDFDFSRFSQRSEIKEVLSEWKRVTEDEIFILKRGSGNGVNAMSMIVDIAEEVGFKFIQSVNGVEFHGLRLYNGNRSTNHKKNSMPEFDLSEPINRFEDIEKAQEEELDVILNSESENEYITIEIGQGNSPACPGCTFIDGQLTETGGFTAMAASLPFIDNSVDLIVSRNLPWLRRENNEFIIEKQLLEMDRVLSENGQIVILTRRNPGEGIGWEGDKKSDPVFAFRDRSTGEVLIDNTAKKEEEKQLFTTDESLFKLLKIHIDTARKLGFEVKLVSTAEQGGIILSRED